MKNVDDWQVDHEQYGRERMGEMSIQPATCGALPAYAVPFGEMQAQI